MTYKPALATLAVAIGLSGCISNTKLALYRFDKGDYYRAAADLKDAAAQGNPEAEVDLGYLAQYGLSVNQDEQAAEQLYEQAMSHGSVRAETCLAVLYLQGKSVPHDYDKAIALLKDADVRGDPFATADLGLAYLIGIGVPVDKEAAKKYSAKMGTAGDDEIMRYVNVMHLRVAWNRKFPADAVKAGHFGKNAVEFDIDQEHATNIKIGHSSGYSDLDQASVEAVASTDFPPPPAGLLQVQHFYIEFVYAK